MTQAPEGRKELPSLMERLSCRDSLNRKAGGGRKDFAVAAAMGEGLKLRLVV